MMHDVAEVGSTAGAVGVGVTVYFVIDALSSAGARPTTPERRRPRSGPPGSVGATGGPTSGDSGGLVVRGVTAVEGN